MSNTMTVTGDSGASITLQPHLPDSQNRLVKFLQQVWTAGTNSITLRVESPVAGRKEHTFPNVRGRGGLLCIARKFQPAWAARVMISNAKHGVAVPD